MATFTNRKPERRPQPSNARRDAAMAVYRHVKAEAEARLAELDGEGCEAGSARAFERGRLEVVTVDMWDALGLPRPTP